MVESPRRLSDVETPAAVLDDTRLRTNCARMLEHCRALGVSLRPHLKTLKSVEAARIAVDASHGGIAVATLNEAEYFAAAGFNDIQYAVCLPPNKLARAADILGRAPGFSFFVDSLDVAAAAVSAPKPPGATWRVWIEIDCGAHRTGMHPEHSALLRVAECLVSGGAALAGVATHAGHAYGDLTISEIAAIAELERQAVVHAAERLRQAGFDCPGVSAGSTPTMVHARSGLGLTEFRAGVYMAGDLFQAGISSLRNDDLAFSVLASVIGHDRDSNQIVIDAGGLALSKDRSTAALRSRDSGYGMVTDIMGRSIFGAPIVTEVHQEHGIVRGQGAPLPFDTLPAGSLVRVFPNHVCMTAAMYDRYHVVKGDSVIVTTWHRTNGWN